MRPQTLFLNIIEFEARLEQMENSVQALREPLKDIREAVADLRSKRNRSASAAAKCKADLPTAGPEV